MASSALFLNLPAEVREMILELLLTSRHPRYVPGNGNDMDKPWLWKENDYIPTKHGIDARILRTCRQMYDEGSRLLYREKLIYGGWNGGVPT